MTMLHPFRFATGAYQIASRSQLLTLARKIEDYGYDVCVTPDHFEPILAPGIALMTIAEATKTLRIGSMVFDNDFRHPAVLAKEAATLDLLSSGRFELGIGAGYMGPDYAMTNIPFDPPGVRVSRLTESVEVLKRLLSGEKVTFNGTYYTLTGLENFPKPTQTPHLPLLVAGGSRRVLSLAGREANIVGLVMRSSGGNLDLDDCSAAATSQRIDWIREAAGERFESLELNTLVFNVTVTDHRERTADEIGHAWGVKAEHILNSIHFLVGTVDQICEDVQRWREQFGISYIAVLQEYVDTFAPVVARLSGS